MQEPFQPTATPAFETTSYPAATSPNMIGDFFGVGGVGGVTAASGPYSGNIIPAGPIVGVQKIAENNSPIPRDRVYVNYSYFDNVPLSSGGVNINRITPGFEKTFLNGWASLDVRVPMADTIDNNINYDVPLAATTFGPSPTNTNFELGNINLNFKMMLQSEGPWTTSTGLGVTLPTGDDLIYYDTTAALIPTAPQIGRIDNESVHLMPFVAALYAPDDRFFSMGFVQLDFDANGNGVHSYRPAQLSPVFPTASNGTLNDPTFLYVDLGVGYWLYRNRTESFIQGVAPVLEVHYNRALTDSDTFSDGIPFVGFGVGPQKDNIENLNVVLGTHFQLAHNSMLTAGYALPVGGGADQQFDGEIRVLLNIFFGG